MAKENYKYRRTFTFNGKRHEVYGNTKQEVFERIQAKKQELSEREADLHNPILNDYYDHFTDLRRNEVSESTLRAQSIQYRLIAGVTMVNGRTFGEMRIKDITRRDIEKARQILLEKGKTPQHLNNSFAHLNHVFNCAVLDDTLQKNPCKSLKQLKRTDKPVGETKHRALTVEETLKFFEYAKQRNSIYINDFALMLQTGLRVGEMSALYMTDIDTKNGFIHVRRTITRDEAGSYHVGDNTKTMNGIRDIPLTEDMLSTIRQQEQLNRMLYGLNWNGLIFKSFDGAILREYQLNREIKRICTAAGIEYFTCHSFRNTFATRFIEQRPQDYKILSEILGHKDISITLNLYTHVMTDNKVSAMNDIKVFRIS